MDKTQFIRLMKGIKSAYPNFLAIDTEEGMEMWFTMLRDINYKDLSMAVQKHIATNKYPPSIAELREMVTHQEPQKDWSEGWGLVVRAISLYGVYRETEALEWLRDKDPLTAEVVRRLSFQDICLSENIATERANFRIAYEAQKKIDTKNKALPPNLQKQLPTSRGIQLEKQIYELFRD